MNIDEIATIVGRIVSKKDAAKRFEKLKSFIDNRTNPQGTVTISVEDEQFDVDPVDLKHILDKKIASEDTTQDETELKQKVK